MSVENTVYRQGKNMQSVCIEKKDVCKEIPFKLSFSKRSDN